MVLDIKVKNEIVIDEENKKVEVKKIGRYESYHHNVFLEGPDILKIETVEYHLKTPILNDFRRAKHNLYKDTGNNFCISFWAHAGFKIDVDYETHGNQKDTLTFKFDFKDQLEKLKERIENGELERIVLP